MQDDLNPLRDRFSIPGFVSIEAGYSDMPRAVVTAPAGEATVYLHGAHVTAYQPRGHAPVLFMSNESHFDPAKPIRGGVPVIFPWFGGKSNDPKAPAHGFARMQRWSLQDVQQTPDGGASITLALRPSDVSRKLWPHDFEASYTVTVGPALDMALEVRNTSQAAFKFEAALHAYLAVADVTKLTVEGLEGRQFIDKVDGMKRKTQQPGAFPISGETDRVYLDTPDTVYVNDAAGGRRLSVAKEGSASTIVWNPWVAKAKAMADFGDDEWPRMICVETANAADNAVTLQPGGRHVMRAVVGVGG